MLIQTQGVAQVSDSLQSTGQTGYVVNSTLSVMIAYCQILLRDMDRNVFSIPLIVWMLNQAQEELCLAVTRHLLRQLDCPDETKTLSETGTVDLLSLEYELFMREHGIDFVRFTDGKYCRKVSEEEYSDDKNRGITYTADRPAYMVRGNTLTVAPFTADQTLDIKYMRRPRLMELGQTASADVSCELDDVLQKIMIGLAMRDHVTRTENAQMAFNWAVQKIEELNKKYPYTESMLYNIDRQQGNNSWVSPVQDWTVTP